jgi:elongation factor G
MAEAEGRLDRQTAAKPQFASVRLSVEPAPPGSDAEEGIVDNRLPPDTISAEYVHAIGLGIRDACAGGPLAGYPVVDWKATILGAEQHDSDSSEVAFEIAARMAFDEALSKASPVLLEPIMKLEITTPEEFFGAISQDLMARRSTIVNTTTNGPLRIINSEAPLSKLFGYVTDLRSLTQGRATSTMEPSHFAAIPADEAAALLH